MHDSVGSTTRHPMASSSSRAVRHSSVGPLAEDYSRESHKDLHPVGDARCPPLLAECADAPFYLWAGASYRNGAGLSSRLDADQLRIPLHCRACTPILRVARDP
jgi:hypothetical protein